MTFSSLSSSPSRDATSGRSPEASTTCCVLRRNWRLQIRAGITGEQTEAYWYLHGPYVITVGKPMYFNDMVREPRSVRAASNMIMDAIINLAAESEQRGSGMMKNSLLVQLYRMLKPLWQRNTAAS